MDTTLAAGRRTPSRARLYGWLRSLHLWLTALTAVPLLVLSLSGAFLVYGHEIQKALEPEVWRVEPRGERLPVATLLARVREQAPDVRVWSMGTGEGAGDAWVLWLADGAGVINLDPYTGTVLRRYHPHGTVNGVVTALHRWLLVDGPARPWVRHAVSAASLVLMVQVVLGVWLWWLPARRWRNATPDFSRGARLAVFRLHQCAGLATAVLMLVVAFTGISLWWIAPTRALVETATGTAVGKPIRPDAVAHAPVPDLDRALAVARVAVPDGRLMHFRVPQKAGEPLMATFGTPGTSTPSQILVGGEPPAVLSIRDGREASAATWFWEIRYRLHMGDFAGDGVVGGLVRALWVALALMPAAFVISGLWLWMKRRGG